MHQEILRQLSRITAEEQAILDGLPSAGSFAPTLTGENPTVRRVFRNFRRLI